MSSSPTKMTHTAAPSDYIRPPQHGYALWSATRTRHFMRRVLNNPKWRGTYTKNIRFLAALHEKMNGGKVDPRVFMWKVNPILFGKSLGWSNDDIYRMVGRHNWAELIHRIQHSSCAQCRCMI